VAFKVSVIFVPLDAVPPVAPVWETVQLKVVPATPDVSAIPVGVPLHILCDAGVATTLGVGLTVMTTLVEVPTHVAAVGVTV
jgi:hypothetical protein